MKYRYYFSIENIFLNSSIASLDKINALPDACTMKTFVATLEAEGLLENVVNIGENLYQMEEADQGTAAHVFTMNNKFYQTIENGFDDAVLDQCSSDEIPTTCTDGNTAVYYIVGESTTLYCCPE